jgi:hypothetical protein
MADSLQPKCKLINLKQQPSITVAYVQVKMAGSFSGIGIARGIVGMYLHTLFCKLESQQVTSVI